MNRSDFDVLSADLRTLAKNVPLHWGAVQNNRTDDNINMFSIGTYAELESKIANLSDSDKNYLRRRWYLWKCAECDEFLFYQNNNVLKNPDKYDKEWDVCINNQFRFDIKGTVIPRDMRNNAEFTIANPDKMVEFFYDKQSTGRRYDIQNRLFIVHHSFVDQSREFHLRCAWQSKERIYKTFIDQIDRISFIDIYNVKAGVIFILEKEQNRVEYKISGL